MKNNFVHYDNPYFITFLNKAIYNLGSEVVQSLTELQILDEQLESMIFLFLISVFLKTRISNMFNLYIGFLFLLIIIIIELRAIYKECQEKYFEILEESDQSDEEEKIVSYWKDKTEVKFSFLYENTF